MYELNLRELKYISQSVGLPVDYTQGGGGNTSVKLSDELMAVKASGFKLKQINPSEGYVVVNYKNIKNFYENVDLSLDKDFEKESTEFVKNNIIEFNGLKTLRPSVEAGFHSILKKFVIHTHSVYANILCCTYNGKELVDKIFDGKGVTFAWIPYINPGFCLTLKINAEIQKSLDSNGKFPEVIFMENHGLIITSDSSDSCVALHKEVNDTIKEYLKAKTPFPTIKLLREDDNTYISKTDFISDFFKNNEISQDFFDKYVLYPDQLVYLNGSVAINGSDKKLNITTNNGEILYKTSYSEAQTIEETLLAYVYVLSQISVNGYALKTMSDKEIDFIKNWESEAYRKKLVKEL